MLLSRYCALLAVFAFAINVFLPFFATYNLPANGHGVAPFPAIFGEKLLICTGDGFKWVKLADLQSGKEKPTRHSDTKCPLCFMARHGVSAIATPVASAVPAQLPIENAPIIAGGARLLPFHLACTLRVRAPPFSPIG